jgi:hypothetical protein
MAAAVASRYYYSTFLIILIGLISQYGERIQYFL